MKRVAVCIKDGEDGCTVVGLVPRGHVIPPYVPLGLNIPASVIFSDCVALACRVHCDGTVSSLGLPRDLPAPSLFAPAPAAAGSPGAAKRRLDAQALQDAVRLYGQFRIVEEFLCVLGARLLDRPYLMMVSAADRTLELPLGHFVYKAKQVDWVAVTPDHLSGDKAPRRPALSRKDANRLDHFLNEYKFGEQDCVLYADLIDVTSVFPFGAAPAPSDVPWSRSQRPNHFGADWGASLRQPFDAANVGALCSPFARGFALGASFTIKEKAQSVVVVAAAAGSSSPVSPSIVYPAAMSALPSLSSSSSSSSASGPNDSIIHFFMMGQQNTGNPGPRFFGRGLNDTGSVGNDLVYHMCCWKYRAPITTATPSSVVVAAPVCSNSTAPAAQQQHQILPSSPGSSSNHNAASQWLVQWSRHVFLRGTAPVRFKSKLGKGIGEATIVLMDDALEGSGAYLASQMTKVQHIAELPAPPEMYSVPPPGAFITGVPAANGSPTAGAAAAAAAAAKINCEEHNAGGISVTSPAVVVRAAAATAPRLHREPARLRCINLLKAVSSAGEDKIGMLFGQSVQKLVSDAGMHIDIEHVDWLGIEAKFGIEASAACIWNSSLLYLESRGGDACTVGHFPFRARLPHQDKEKFTAADLAYHRQHHVPGDPAPHFIVPHVISQQQNRFLRYNCADSLDRTNLASFFVVAQLCSKLFLHLNVVPERLVSRGPANSALYEQQALPSAKEQAAALAAAAQEEGEAKENLDDVKLPEIPPDSELPPCYFHTVADMVANMPEPLLRALVELFVSNGDAIANLFTSTGAIHTSHMRKLVPDMRGAPANAFISMQRRYENVLRDKKKYRVLDIVVGKETKPFHFPTIPVQYFVWPLPKMLWPCAVLLRCNGAGTAGLFGAKELQNQLPADVKSHVVEIREQILATGRDITVAGANAEIRAAAAAAAASGNTPRRNSMSSRVNNGDNNNNNSCVLSREGSSFSVALPMSPAVSGAVLADLKDEEGDYSFLTFDRFYAAVILFDSPATAAKFMLSTSGEQKQLPLIAADGQKVSAELKPYAYEYVSEEPPTCLRVKTAAQLASQQSPLAKISKFFFGGSKDDKK